VGGPDLPHEEQPSRPAGTLSLEVKAAAIGVPSGTDRFDLSCGQAMKDWYLVKRGRAAAATSQATTGQAAKPPTKLTRSHVIIGIMGLIIVGLLISNQSPSNQTQVSRGREAPPQLRLEDVHRAVTGARWVNVNCGPVERNAQGQFWSNCSLSGGIGS
jgi:hypothetical protein